MKIYSLELENFMLFKSFKKKFGDKDIIGIIAEYAANKERSNKGGKSTIPEAIRYILFGDSRAEREVELIHHGADQMMGILVLDDDDGKKITIKRGRDIKNNGILEVSGCANKKESQAFINELIGMDSQEFVLTNFIKQQDINLFLNLGSAQKKALFSKWLKNDHWVKLEKAVKLEVSQLVTSDLKISSKIDLLKTQRENIKELSEQRRIINLDALEETAKIEGLKDKIFKLQQKKSKFKGLKEKRKQLEELKKECTDARKDLDLKIVLTKKKRRFEVKIEKLNLGSKKLCIMRDEFAICKSQIAVLKTNIVNAKARTGVCPVLKKSCDRISPNTKTVKKWKQERDKLTHRLDQLETRFSDVEEANNTQKDLAWVNGQIEGLKATESMYAKLIGRFRDLSKTIKTLSSTQLEDLNQRLTLLQNKYSNIIKRRDALLIKIGEIDQREISQQKIKKEIKQLEKTKANDRLRRSDLLYLCFLFGKNGIPSLEIENAFGEIQDEINFVLDRLDSGLQVQFKAERELSTLELNCVECLSTFPSGAKVCKDCGAKRKKQKRDELNIKVIENGVEGGFHMESGGGKTLVSLSTRIALTRLIQRQTGSRFKVIFMDEPDTALDDVNKDVFMRLITKTLIKEFHFEQVFWITHAKEIQESIPNVLKIKRFSSYSKAVWV